MSDFVRLASDGGTNNYSITGAVHGRGNPGLSHTPASSDLDIGLAPGSLQTIRVDVRVGPDRTLERCAALVERRVGKAGDPRFRARHHRSGKSEVRAPRGAYCHLRSGWHALGRASGLQSNDVLL